MPRIAGVEIPEQKRIEFALPAIFGIGRARARDIAKDARLQATKKISELNAEEINRLRAIIERKGKVEGDLRMEIRANIKRLKDIKSYRGIRHMRGLPVRGQRTKTNSRTRRGNVRRTMGSGKRTLEKK